MLTPRKLRAFWRNITAGLTAEELWAQFRRETRTSVAIYSAETGRNVPEEWAARKRRAGIVRSVIRAMFYRLSPTRRVTLLIAFVLMLLPHTVITGDSGWQFSLPGSGLAALLLLLLLALELADRVGLKRDLEIAREIQRMLVPADAPHIPGFEIAFATKPANTVAGDYYDAFLRPALSDAPGGRRLMLFVADVAGKGIPSGLLMATFQASVHLLSEEPTSLTALAERLNRSVCERSGNGRHFITCFAAELDMDTRALAWVNAGHNPPLLVRAGSEVERLSEGGLPFGMFAQAPYSSGHTTLLPGDGLFIYTDGVTEAQDEAGGEYGEARLESLAVRMGGTHAADCIGELFASIQVFTGAELQADDITCLVLRVAAPAGSLG